MNYPISKEEYKNQVSNLAFTSKAQARKDTGLSYLGAVNSSAKIVKGEKMNYDTFILYLSPSKLSGFNVCPMASAGCIAGCLNTSGHSKLQKEWGVVQTARLKKTWLFFFNREFFLDWLFAEIETAARKAKKNGRNFAIRLNGTSDLNIKLFTLRGVNVLDRFNTVQFYDYTKVSKQLDNSRDNYHVTFSYSETNVLSCFAALDKGFNVAVPFYRELPSSWFNTPVINGDETDLRFFDESGRIVGLKVKRIKDKAKEKEALKAGFFVTA